MTTWEYIRALFRPNDRVAICWKLSTDKHFHQRVVTAEVASSDRYQRFLRAMNAQGNNIYIGMNPIRPESKQHRRKEDIAEVRRLYLDIDINADQVLNTILNDSSLPAPTYILNTSPGKYQVIWNVRNFERNDAEALMRTLCRQFHTDPATVDISRVFRLPGLHNKKYAATFQVTLDNCHRPSTPRATFPLTRQLQAGLHLNAPPRHSPAHHLTAIGHGYAVNFGTPLILTPSARSSSTNSRDVPRFAINLSPATTPS